MTPPRYFSIGPFHILLKWGHDWIPNAEHDGTGYTCWRCSKRKDGKAYPVRKYEMEVVGDTLVGHVVMSPYEVTD